MKILHLLQSDKFSGAENVVSQIIGVFKDTPDIEMVYCSRDGQIREALAERDINFAPINALNIKEVKRVIREQKPDIIHAHDMNASFIAACACGKIPLISHIHNNNFNSRRLSLKSIAYLFAAIKAKHIFWVSQSSYNGYSFHKFLKKKSSVLYNIVNIEALYKKMETDENEYDYDVIYVGRLTYQKNPQRLMHIFHKIKSKCPDIKIAVVGTGDLEAETKSLCNELNLNPNVEFMGFKTNPLKMLHDSKVMIMTSRWEGTPMCALEAMALGVPIVSTPTDGLCDLITDGENGYLSDDDDILAKKAVDIVTNNAIHSTLNNNTKAKSLIINDPKSYKEHILTTYLKAVCAK
ncbi:MAG: glycosyltransferase [Clostridia bacterium]|nr:glycosyltransferase [Clostridia bacterium]